MKFDLLEDRCTPTVFSHDSQVIIGNQLSYQPFGAFNVADNTAGHGDIYVAGAPALGGPRVQVVQTDGVAPPKVLFDTFAFETTFLGGVNVSTDGQYVVASAASKGGPAVVVYDLSGKQLSRFFAFDPLFTGGADAQIYNGVIYVTPGVGGGPVVEQFNLEGKSIGAFYGAPSNLRSGFDIVVAPDVTGITTINLVSPTGTVYVNYPGLGQYGTSLPAGFKQMGYSGAALNFGMNGYITGEGIDLGFNQLAPLFAFDNHAAGNSSPPPTTGFKMGVYFPTVSPFVPASTTTSRSSLGRTVIDLSGESVGAVETGTGTLFVPMVGPDGITYAVTASHVTDTTVYQLIAPGPLDGPKLINYGYPTFATNYRTGTYSVDMAAVPTKLPLTSAVLFNGVYYPISGVAIPQIGQQVVAVGRANETGVGIYTGPEQGTVHVDNGYTNGADLAGQFVVGPSIYGPLAIPGFSGGPAFTLTVDETGVHRWLVGMVVAGNGVTTYVTPVSSLEQASGFKVLI